ncbi:MAG TPA: lysophospholipid acyltransferase family protein [Pyrinomonadaceae bacterium]|nr:lysophospholipid acyltransferase family protein [Pyrinomonadaceae bacterium]
MSENTLSSNQNAGIEQNPDALAPTAEEISVLSAMEKYGFRLTHRMNRGAWKRFWTFCQRHVGSLWIQISTYNLMNVFGLENFAKTDLNRPVLLVSNHRSFFDMYVVSTALFRRTDRRFQLFFPVRAKFFYDSPVGWFVNLVMGWFSMYPPFFREAGEMKKREFDKFSLRRLIQICSEAKPNIIGFHPEGKRNLNEDPYEFLPAQPGIGKVILNARPQVVPVFIAGLGNDLPKQVLGNWRGGEKIRVHFGEPLDLSELYEKRDSLRTHKEIADLLMRKIGELAENDKIFMQQQEQQ